MATNPSEEDIAMSWCLKNDIKIYAVPISNSQVKIEYRKGIDAPRQGTEVYKSKDVKDKDAKWWVRIRQLYIEFYSRRPTHNKSLS